MLFNDEHIIFSCILILLFLIIIGLIIKSVFDISKIGYLIICSFISLYLIEQIILSIVNFQDELPLYYISYVLLFTTHMFYANNLNKKNQYHIEFKLNFINEAKYKERVYFDEIINNITEHYSNSDKYQEAKNAYNYYYAIKKNNNAEFTRLNVDSREKISSIFRLWLKCENVFSYDQNETLFFNLCKIMTNKKITDEYFNLYLKLFFICIQNETNSYGEIDIDTNNDESLSALSNSYEAHFAFNNIEFTSIESFLQGLKYKNSNIQAKVFMLTDKQTQKINSLHNWWIITGNLYFKGEKIKRYSKAYHDLIVSAFHCKYTQCNEFRQSLLNTDLKSLKCSCHKTNEFETLLTQEEYIDMLNYFRIKEFNKHYLNETK